jgi:hypothetical protein
VLQDRHWSEQVAKQAVWLSGLADYEQAAEVLYQVGQVDISDTSIWRLAQKWGERLKVLEAKEQEKAQHLPEPGEMTRRVSRSKGRMGASMDGTMIHIREEGWKELKVGCVFDVVVLPTVDPETKEWIELGHARRNTYVSHLGGPEELGSKLWAEAERRHWSAAVDTQIVADAASWIWNQAHVHFYDSQQVVDWFHAKEHLSKAAQLLHGEGTQAAKHWLKEQENSLFQGHADQIAKLIAKAAQECPSQAESLLEQAGYFENNKRRMNYLELRAEGWLIGSGTVESGGKQYKDRFAGPGMHWSRIGAERLLPIRTAIISDRFDQRWCSVYNSPPN